jgi:formimidoylglutamate deiminase
MPRFYEPDLIYAGGVACAGKGLLVGDDGTVAAITTPEQAPEGSTVVRMPGKALLPGLANAHSHTFQRLFRGRAEGRISGGDTFWTWREQMYRAAGFVSPEDLYDVARATFLEMLAGGITVVGEFHYLHRDTGGRAYGDPNLLSRQVIAAAQSVGIRICLLRSAYFRAGYQLAPHTGQRRFYETAEEYLRNLEELATSSGKTGNVTIGAAPHSIRAVPLEAMGEIAEHARRTGMPLHLHISEQTGENVACQAEYGVTPVTLIAAHGILSAKTTLIHAIHLSEWEYEKVAASGATICSCPTTERNLGDGIFPADTALRLGIPVALGTDSQAQIDVLEDSRQLEYHLRLAQQQRGILDASAREGWAAKQPAGDALFRSASASGYAALRLNGGSLSVGQPADFFTIDLDDLAILGVDRETLASQAVFAVSRSAVRDVAVQGRIVIQDGCHVEADDIRSRYRSVQQRYQSSTGESA